MPRAGGGVDANVARWKGQFTKLTADDVKEEKVAGMKVHIVELKGDKFLQDKISENGYRLYKEKLNPKAIGKEFLNIVEYR